MPSEKRRYGDAGEAAAASFLKNKGMRVCSVQYATPYGELDLVCRDGEEFVFVEVKTRRSDQFGFPEEAVTEQKLRRLLRAAHVYLENENCSDARWRVDVVAIRWSEGERPRIVHYPALDSPEASW